MITFDKFIQVKILCCIKKEFNIGSGQSNGLYNGGVGVGQYTPIPHQLGNPQQGNPSKRRRR